MKSFIVLCTLLWTSVLISQTTISGKLTDTKDQPIVGANVYLDGTYDGATTNEEGNFNFETNETGTQVLTISYLSYIIILKNSAVLIHADVIYYAIRALKKLVYSDIKVKFS